MIFSDLPSPAEAPSQGINGARASRRRETGTHPGSGPRRAFSRSALRADRDRLADGRACQHLRLALDHLLDEVVERRGGARARIAVLRSARAARARDRHHHLGAVRIRDGGRARAVRIGDGLGRIALRARIAARTAAGASRRTRAAGAADQACDIKTTTTTMVVVVPLHSLGQALGLALGLRLVLPIERVGEVLWSDRATAVADLREEAVRLRRITVLPESRVELRLADLAVPIGVKHREKLLAQRVAVDHEQRLLSLSLSLPLQRKQRAHRGWRQRR